MTRAQIIDQISSSLGTLTDAKLTTLADLVRAWSQPTVFSTLSPAERAELDAAVDSLDRGEDIALVEAEASFEARLRAAGT